MALRALPRLTTAFLLATAAVLQGRLGHVGAQDACTDYDLACAEDSVCSACKETAGTNTVAFETCVAYYVYEASTCVNQSMQPCCQAEASDTDCLANQNYTNFYDCRLQNDVGDDCTSLVCDAVGTEPPSSSGTTDVVNEADAAADSDDGSGAGRAFGREGGGVAASILVVATAVSVAAAAAAFV